MCGDGDGGGGGVFSHKLVAITYSSSPWWRRQPQRFGSPQSQHRWCPDEAAQAINTYDSSCASDQTSKPSQVLPVLF